jgi:type I restriction enzyme R subunit
LATLRTRPFNAPTDEDQKAELALKIDATIREIAPAGRKGDETRERQVQNALFRLLERDRAATQALFDIVNHQQGY